jgi:hypothetical protein
VRRAGQIGKFRERRVVFAQDAPGAFEQSFPGVREKRRL